MRGKPLYVAFIFLLMATLACSVTGGQPDLAATITAQAQLINGQTGTPGGVTETPAASLSTTPSVPEVSVTADTNCRTGPSSAFDLVFTVTPGQTETLVGKDTPDNYWIINDPAGGTCWLWGMNAVVTGNTSGLPEYPPPTRPTPKFTKTPKPTNAPESTNTPKPTTAAGLPPAAELPPAPPGNLSYKVSCIPEKGSPPKWIEHITLTWQDNAINETGYKIYKNSSLFATVGPNSTQYSTSMSYPPGIAGIVTNDAFAVSSFNDGGSSTRPSVNVAECH